jgi:hypothetical protein
VAKCLWKVSELALVDGAPQATDQSYNMAATLLDGHKISQLD